MHSFHFNANFNLLAAQPLDLFDINLLRLNPQAALVNGKYLNFISMPLQRPPLFFTRGCQQKKWLKEGRRHRCCSMNGQFRWPSPFGSRWGKGNIRRGCEGKKGGKGPGRDSPLVSKSSTVGGVSSTLVYRLVSHSGAISEWREEHLQSR